MKVFFKYLLTGMVLVVLATTFFLLENKSHTSSQHLPNNKAVQLHTKQGRGFQNEDTPLEGKNDQSDKGQINKEPSSQSTSQQSDSHWSLSREQRQYKQAQDANLDNISPENGRKLAFYKQAEVHFNNMMVEIEHLVYEIESAKGNCKNMKSILSTGMDKIETAMTNNLQEVDRLHAQHLNTQDLLNGIQALRSDFSAKLNVHSIKISDLYQACL